MSDITPEDAIKMMDNISTKLREAIVKSMPCAFEQFLTISIPGQVIDTTMGGSFVSENLTKMTVDRHDEVRINESRLVDSMVPLDKMMLGPTGKSVARSYYTALDTLVPRKTDIGSTEVNLNSVDTTTRYGQAMTFLRTSLPPSKKPLSADRVKEAKKKAEQLGADETIVERYVEKQMAWAEARGRLDEARNDAIDAKMNRPEHQSSAQFSERQRNIKRAQSETHAKWMDWVVNGDKFRVDYAFALVDRDSIMARIEKAKEATRDSMIYAIDGTEWAAVTLEPKNWAYLCRAKALDFRNRNPIDPDVLRMKLDNLKRMKEAFTAYDSSFRDRDAGGLVKFQRDFESAQKKYLDILAVYDGKIRSLKAEPQEELEKLKLEESELKDDIKNLETEQKTADDTRKPKIEAELTTKKDRLAALEGDGGEIAKKTKEVESVGEQLTKERNDAKNAMDTASGALATKKNEYKAHEEGAAKKLRDATERLYKLEKETSEARKNAEKDKGNTQPLTDALNKLEVEKDEWLSRKRELQVIQSEKTMAELEKDGTENMSKSIGSRIKQLDAQIIDLEKKLGDVSVPAQGLPSAIIDIDKDRNIIHANESEMRALPGSDLSKDEGVDIWSKVSFTIDAKSDSSQTKESATSGGAHLNIGGWWSTVQADSSFSSASKSITKAMSECSVDGSFSAMLVTIRRPWLHADLFQDFDIDTPDDVKLSPGAAQIKTWIEKGDNETGVNKLTDYGKFPAYPTSFIVAADTVLELKSTESKSQEMMSALSTDSSIKASFGPWGMWGGASASLKTDNKESSMKMEVRGGALRISFQAPQVIGWVSEILPQLPRRKDAGMGGLAAPPHKLFRL